ncbi:hypothetical protein B0A52_07144 [Exophiala mesophila]|uniref:Uncharacterized protein n=1 Tax=Exophiala mesophila TaxID=212818 RepID=A0A438N0C6_EXOME|nr:hypothetical protein B0A52_07144 [Exophiala mesophila]
MWPPPAIYNPVNGSVYYASYDAYHGFVDRSQEQPRDPSNQGQQQSTTAEHPLIMPPSHPSGLTSAPGYSPSPNAPRSQSESLPQSTTQYALPLPPSQHSQPYQYHPGQFTDKNPQSLMRPPEQQFWPFHHPAMFPVPANAAVPNFHPPPFSAQQPIFGHPNPFELGPPGHIAIVLDPQADRELVQEDQLQSEARRPELLNEMDLLTMRMMTYGLEDNPFLVLVAENEKPCFFDTSLQILPFSSMSQVHINRTKSGMAQTIHDPKPRHRLSQGATDQRYTLVTMRKNLVIWQGVVQHNQTHLMLRAILSKSGCMRIGANQDQGRAVEGEAEPTWGILVTLLEAIKDRVSESVASEGLGMRAGDEIIVEQRHTINPTSSDDYHWYDEDGIRVRVREI